jgi:uncharacterized protein YbcI
MTERAAGNRERVSEETPRGDLLELANAMVGFYKDAFGRGPTRARANYAGPDTVVVVLENSLTVAERNLVAMGEHTRLRDARIYFQYAVEAEMRSIAERALGRRTVAFVSGIDTDRDVAIEAFMLEPQAKPPGVREPPAR